MLEVCQTPFNRGPNQQGSGVCYAQNAGLRSTLHTEFRSMQPTKCSVQERPVYKVENRATYKVQDLGVCPHLQTLPQKLPRISPTRTGSSTSWHCRWRCCFLTCRELIGRHLSLLWAASHQEACWPCKHRWHLCLQVTVEWRAGVGGGETAFCYIQAEKKSPGCEDQMKWPGRLELAHGPCICHLW